MSIMNERLTEHALFTLSTNLVLVYRIEKVASIVPYAQILVLILRCKSPQTRGYSFYGEISVHTATLYKYTLAVASLFWVLMVGPRMVGGLSLLFSLVVNSRKVYRAFYRMPSLF